MFITCPNCKELVKKAPGECPLCKFPITAEYILAAEREEKEQREELERKNMEIYRQRNKIGVITLIVYSILVVSAIVIGSLLPNPVLTVIMMEVVIHAALIIVILKTKINKCPYCNAEIDDDSLLGPDFCPKCGGRLR